MSGNGAIKVGVLGFAHGHVHVYLDQWQQNPALGIVAVAGWDHDNVRAIKSCNRHNFICMPTVEALLEVSDIQAVVIAAETAYHADLVSAAAAAGKAIVLQKPLALTLEEADKVVAVIEKHRVPFTLAWQMRVDPHNLKIKELMENGRFGKVYMVRRRHCLPMQKWPDFEHSWHVDAKLNRDIFADDAAHAVDFLLWLIGMPQSVVAELGTLWKSEIVNDNAIAIFRYSNGAFGEISCTFAAVANENTCEVVCEHGTIVANYGDLVSCMNPWPNGAMQLKWFYKDDAEWTTATLPDVKSQNDRIAGLAKPLADFLHGLRPAIATAEEGRQVLQMIIACYEAYETGCRVNL